VYAERQGSDQAKVMDLNLCAAATQLKAMSRHVTSHHAPVQYCSSMVLLLYLRRNTLSPTGMKCEVRDEEEGDKSLIPLLISPRSWKQRQTGSGLGIGVDNSKSIVAHSVLS
jgi:hypothetical protein